MSLKLTIVMPLTDVIEDLHRSLASLIANLTPECEVLGIGWRCTPEVEAYFRQTLAGQPNVRFIPMEPNEPAGHCFNVGIREAQGEYLTFMEADDELTPASLERILATVEEKKSLDVVILTAAVGRMDDEMYYIPKYPMRSFSGPCEGSGLKLLEKLGKEEERLRCEVFLGCYRKQFLISHELFVEEDMPGRMAHCWTPRVYFYAHHCSTMRKLLPSFWCMQRPYVWTTKHREDFIKSFPLSMLSLADFYQDHYRDMPIYARKAWAFVTYRSLINYFFNPKYAENWLTKEEELQILRKLWADSSMNEVLHRMLGYLPWRQKMFCKFLEKYAKSGSSFLPWLWGKITPRE